MRTQIHPERTLFKTRTRLENESILLSEPDMKGESKQTNDAMQPTKQLAKYDCWEDDLPPEVWLEKCKAKPEAAHAKTLVYSNYKYIWADVKVLEYDPKRNKFLVQVLNQPTLKYVGRLSLQFNDEDPQKFKLRLDLAKERQLTAEDEMRFYKYVDSQSDTNISLLQPEEKKKIQNKLFTKKGNEKMYNLKSLESLMDEVEKLFKLHMKKFNIISEMKDPQTHYKYNTLRIKVRERDEEVPYYALFDQLAYNFRDFQVQVKEQHPSANKKVVLCLNTLMEKSYEFNNLSVLATNILPRELPLDLKKFGQIQQLAFSNGKQTLLSHWREHLIGEVQDIIRSDFNCYQTDPDEYFETSFQKLIKKIDYIFNYFVRELVTEFNVRNWTNFIRRFVYPQETKTGEYWRVSEVPLLILNINFRKKDSTKDKKDKKKEKEKAKAEKEKEKEKAEGEEGGEENKEDENEEDEASETDENEMIYFSPSKDKITKAFIRPIEWIVELTNAINKLEPDIVPLIKMDKQPSYNVTVTEDAVAKAISQVKEFVAIGFKEPTSIINKFKKYQFLYEKSKKDVLKGLFDKQKPTVQNLVSELKRLAEAMREVGSLCINEKNTHLFQVRTQNIKENIISRATEINQSILSKISDLCSDMIKSVNKGFEKMLEELSTEPKDEDELVLLKSYIENHEIRIEQYEEQVKQISDYLEILEDNQYNFKEADWGNYWNLKTLPPEIRTNVIQAQRVVNSFEARFMDRLEKEKLEFEREIQGFVDDFRIISRFNSYKNVARNSQDVQILRDKLTGAQAKVKNINYREDIFKQPISQYEHLLELIQQFEPYSKMWDLCFEFSNELHEWYTGNFLKLKFQPIATRVDQTSRETMRLTKIFQELSEDASTVMKSFKEEIDNFKIQMPLIEMLTTEAMIKKPQHWEDIYRECNIPTQDLNELSLKGLIDMNMLEHREKLEEISKKADKQWNIEKKIGEMSEKIKYLAVELMPHKTGISVIKTTEEIQQFLDEQLTLVQVLKASPDVKPILAKATVIENKLLLIQDTLENWIKCQRGWLYLEPIFASEDIKWKLPMEQKSFEVIDIYFRHTMDIVAKEPKMFDNHDVIDLEKMNQELESHNKSLDVIQKALADYLETKRKAFARFFFLSDDELLEILAQTKDPTAVQPHMSKCFEAISEVEFNSNMEVVAMISAEKEKVKFIKSVNVNEGDKKGNVEKWLLEVENVMQKTLHQITRDSLRDVNTKRVDWVRKWPGQVILAVNQIRWTSEAESALTKAKDLDLEGFDKQLTDELNDIIELVRGDLTDLERLTLGALVVIDVHARDVIHDLVVKGVESATDFEWLSQLRYYWEENALKVRMINAELKYNFEYLGNSTRLVITPLTDRCYRTLIGAFYLQYGGAPEGPAGTGKTESVKDLAKAIAIQCVVFNCSDTLNYLAMRKFFKGLASSGAWCCFDEFNRIDLEVLSVIAQQVMQIQEAIKGRKKNFWFDDAEISLIPSCAINITMNPGYAGRSELPDNLKALFRPCAMMVPDYSLISEIILYSYGFKDARNLARKIVASLKLSSEQLSTQQHYDFGMRALKAILTAAGQLKRTMTENEDIICMRALYDVNLPKFTMNDIPLFLSITSDLFPGNVMPESDYTMLEQALIHVLENDELIPEKSFLKKCIQLYETIMVRHGLMLVGAAFSGKSKVLEALEKAMNHLKGKGSFTGAKSYKLNPKSITITQLYGKFDPDSKAWSDGVLPLLMRVCVRDYENPERKWMMFDGPVDAVWIENMNTVLDDNKKLCLTSGEIVKLTPQMTMMFEVEDLFYASPATVSRCGMVYLETKNLGWEALLKAYMYKIPTSLVKQKDYIFDTLRWFMDACLSFVKKYGKFPMHISEMAMANSTINLMQIFLKEYDVEGLKVPGNIDETLNNLILFSCIWAIGGVLEEPVRPEFHKFLMKLLACNDVAELYKIDTDKQPFEPRAYKLRLSDPENIFDLVFERSKGSWINWLQVLAGYQIPEKASFHQLIIPTVESVRTSFFVNLLVQNSKHILFTGPTGTGKTISIQNELKQKFTNEDYANLTTVFSGQTQANQLQKTIEAKMTTRRRKGVFAPEDRKKFMIVFIDDLNMPAKEVYGAQPPIELLRQWMDFGGWYDLETKEFKSFVDMIFIAAMGPPSAGRNTITNRYARHFTVQYTEPFSSHSLQKIFNSVMDWYFNNMPNTVSRGIASMRDNIVNSTIELYNKIKVSKELLPTPAKSHYIYNLRDISKVFQGISKATNKSFIDDSDFIKLWIHECLRVFHDRLISEEDRDFFIELLKGILKANFRRNWEDLVTVEPILWASFVPTIWADSDQTKKLTNVYCELTDRDAMKKAADAALEEYNSFSSNKMNLVLFTFAIEHVIKIVRVMSTPLGHSLLVGVGGSGRKSLAILASAIVGLDIYQIEINKGYDQKSWVEDLQNLLKQCGIENKETAFIFTDTQIWKEAILEDISSLLNNGEVPGLFPADERAKIVEEISSVLPEGGTANEKYNYFISKCKENLHLILCFSPVGEAFRRRLRIFPSLVNNTTIDWFLPWPEEALKSVATYMLNEQSIEESFKESIVDICVDMQTRIMAMSVRYYQELRKYYYVTPTSYLELLSTFKRLLTERINQVNNSIHRYESGLEKLLKTEEEVTNMKQELTNLTPQLVEKSKEVTAMMQVIQVEKKEADAQREICAKEEAECNIQKEEALKLRTECQAELDKVLPILERAEAALNSVDKNELNTLKSYQKVADPITMTMKVLCIIMKVDAIRKKEGIIMVEDYWETAKKKVLVNVDKLLKDVKSYDVQKISTIDTKTIEKVKTFLTVAEFDYEVVKRASSSAANLSLWIRAVIETYDAYLVVDPKQRELEQAETTLKQAESLLAEKKAVLKAVEDKIEALRKDFDDKNAEKENLQAKVDKCKVQLERAKKLIDGLAGEKLMWGKRAAELRESSKNVIGDVLLCSGIIAYLGAFPRAYREEAQAAWSDLIQSKGIQQSTGFNLQNILSDAVTIGSWTNRFKLPNDSLSIDNAIIMQNSARYPLMIDPQIQANRWIREMEKSRKLLVIRPTQSANEYNLSLESAISYGFPVLFENVGEVIDPLFDSILSQKKIKQGGGWKMKVGDNFIDYSNDFKLYITTKLPKPHYAPEICVKVALLNFTVTPEGLEDNMLNIVVKAEEPSMEERRQKNIIEYFENKNKQKQTEDRILKQLSESSGNILDDEELIETLKSSKEESEQIERQLEAQQRDQERFQHIRNFYQIVAKRVSALFFVVADLANIEPMYQYSLDWYTNLYFEAIRTSAIGKERRCLNIIEKFTTILYENVCRSLLEKDKLLFSFLMCVKIMQSENKIDMSELRFFLVGGTGIDVTEPNPTEEFGGWLTNKQWASFIELEQHFATIFKDFTKDFKTYVKEWQQVFNSTDPMNISWPSGWSTKLTLVQKLIILRILRPDKVIAGVQELIIQEMGKMFIEGGGALDMSAVYEDSCRNRNDPLIFILSPGVDPISEILKLADKQGLRSSVIPLSLGQGQDKIAEFNISLAIREGKWVVLQNCHLAPSWMPSLERILEQLPHDSHDNYRMWLTSMPSDKFPVSVLQNGIKLTNEPPKGLKNNLLRSYKGLDVKKFNEGEKTYEWKKLLFGLCFFHAHVQERKKFGPLGWNIPYEFSGADLAISISQLRIFLDQYEEIQWDALNYMVAEANYGGRVTDPMDRRLIKVILKDFYTKEILLDEYKFSPSGIYFAPQEGALGEYIDYINELPFNDTSEIFGLHENAEISSAINDTNQLLGAALSLQPRSTGGGNLSGDQVIKEKCTSILQKLPKPFDVDHAAKKYPVLYEESMNTVLQQELLRYNRLLNTVANSLVQLGKAIDGLVVMSNELEEVYNKMFDNLVPDTWHKVAYPSRKPLASWINDLVDRLAFMQKWVDEGAPASFWISGFYFTQSFLSGVLQNYSRKTGKAIDTLTYDFAVIKRPADPRYDVNIAPANGCYVYGLFLDGCRWDDENMVLAEPLPKILNYTMAYIWLKPMEQDEIDKAKHVYECPVYKTSRRAGTLSTTGHSTNFVLNMNLPIAANHSSRYWIKRGVALLTQLDD